MDILTPIIAHLKSIIQSSTNPATAVQTQAMLSNSPTFPFLNLPRELRDEIYAFSTAQETTIRDQRAFLSSEPLLHVNRQVREETLYHILHNYTFISPPHDIDPMIPFAEATRNTNLTISTDLRRVEFDIANVAEFFPSAEIASTHFPTAKITFRFPSRYTWIFNERDLYNPVLSGIFGLENYEIALQIWTPVNLPRLCSSCGFVHADSR